jgi:heat shock protein HslJ
MAIGALAAVVLVVTASASPVAAAAAPLVGTNWVLRADASIGVRVGTVSATAQFGNDGRLNGDAACNSFTTTYSTTGHRMTIQSPAATTLVQCGRRADRVATAYLAALGKVRTFSISGSTLTLRGRGNVSLVYRAASAREIVGSWNVTSFYTGSAVASVQNGTTLTAEFTASQISGDSGCNNYTGPYQATGTTISIGPLASTLRACAQPGVDTQEQQYLAALQLAKGYRVTRDELELLRDGGTIAATFTRK